MWLEDQKNWYVLPLTNILAYLLSYAKIFCLNWSEKFQWNQFCAKSVSFLKRRILCHQRFVHIVRFCEESVDSVRASSGWETVKPCSWAMFLPLLPLFAGKAVAFTCRSRNYTLCHVQQAWPSTEHEPFKWIGLPWNRVQCTWLRVRQSSN